MSKRSSKSGSSNSGSSGRKQRPNPHSGRYRNVAAEPVTTGSGSRRRSRALPLAAVLIVLAAGGLALSFSGGSSPQPTVPNVPIVTATVQNSQIDSVACWSATSCLAVGAIPGHAGQGEGAYWLLKDGQPGQSHPVSGTASLVAVSCPSAGKCLLGGRSPEIIAKQAGMPSLPGVGVTFQVSNGVAGTLDYITSLAAVVGISCWYPGDCMGIGSAPSGAGVTFGLRGTSPISLVVSPKNGTYETVSCVALGHCEIASFLNPNNAASDGIVLPWFNDAVGLAQKVSATLGLWGMSCQSAASCMAVGMNREPLSSKLRGTFVPVQGGTPGPVVTVAGAAQLYSVDCLPSECVAVGAATGNVDGALVIIKNNQVAKLQKVASPQYFDHVACPTSNLCVLTGRSGLGSVIDEMKI